ncbi:MAG: protein kinase [Acidobacteria bacterium]|nr:protein kinase [Acidobacteriota bacterium]
MFHRIGKYEILGSLGQGAMGEVFLAKDPAIGRTLAIKTILASSTAGADAKERFAQEAKAAGALNHPGIVTIHEFGEDQGVLYLAMEFVEGDDLQVLLAEKRLSKAELLEVLAQVSEALAYAHRRGVLHRDVKPSNIRVSHEGGRMQAKLMDFGIARISESTLTSTGLLMGTVAYMAPEYVKHGRCDGRADLFAVGVMLYEGLSGQLPFGGETTATILYRLVHEPPKPLPPSALVGASPALRGVLDHALAKDPDYRYRDGDALAASLRAAKDPAWSGDGSAATVAVLRPAAKGSGGKKFATAAALIAALSASALFWRHRHGAMQVAAAPTPTIAPAPAAAAPASVPPPQAPETKPEPVASSPATLPAPTPSKTEIEPAPRPEPKPSVKAEPKPDTPQHPAPAPAPPEAASQNDSASDGDANAASNPHEERAEAAVAAKLIETNPVEAHREFAPLIQQEPGNAHFRALDLTALANAGDSDGFIKAWDASSAAGVDPRALLFTPRFSGMLKAQQRNPTLSQDALARLVQAYGSVQAKRRWGRR